jgi:hypothetical protein
MANLAYSRIEQVTLEEGCCEGLDMIHCRRKSQAACYSKPR